MGVRRARWMLLLAAGCANLSSFTGGDAGTGADTSASDSAADVAAPDTSPPADSSPAAATT